MPTSEYMNFHSHKYEQYCVKNTQLYKLAEIFINISNIICLEETAFLVPLNRGQSYLSRRLI